VPEPERKFESGEDPMAHFDEEQLTEIMAAVRAGLGLEGDKPLSEVMKELVHGVVNNYDKRTSKEREAAGEKLEEQLKGITDTLEKIGKGGGDDQNLDDPDAEIDLKKLPAGLRAFVDRQNKAMEKLEKQVDDEKKAREKAQGEAQEAEDKRAAQALRDALRTVSLDKDAVGVEFDPAMSEVMIEHLAPRVRKAETGDGYEYQTGVEEVSQEAIFKPLAEGLKHFGGTTIGKRFQVPVKGSGVKVPAGGADRKPGETVSAGELAGMSPADIRKASDEGRIDIEQ
jgi:hypothetical protein